MQVNYIYLNITLIIQIIEVRSVCYNEDYYLKNLIMWQKIIDFLKKTGILKVGVTTKKYQGTKDKPYQIDVDPLDND